MSDYPIKSPRKLIEVALPLDAINVASTRENYIYRGNPSSLHKWWAQRPLAAARAVVFAQMVNDPAGLWEIQNPGQRPSSQQRSAWTRRRKELFEVIEKIVVWENITKEEVLDLARAEIKRSWREVCEQNKNHPQASELFNPLVLPTLHDPFAGGGTIPLEAQRLGLNACASDLNPVAVLINKAMIEIPPKFAGRPPVSLAQKRKEAMGDLGLNQTWTGVTGLAEDVSHYGAWMREEARKRIGHLYPPVEITSAMAEERPDLQRLVGQKLTVIAWLWARTVKSPNPAFSHIAVPLASSFVLSSKENREVYVEPIIENDRYYFKVRLGSPPSVAAAGTTAGKRKAFRCLMSTTAIDYNHIRAEGKAGRMGQKLMAAVVEGGGERIFLSPTEEIEVVAAKAKPSWKPEMTLPDNPRDFKTPNYGLTTYGDLFTSRQLLALTTLCDLVGEARKIIHRDALDAGYAEGIPIEAGGRDANAYAEAVAVYLAFSVDKYSMYGNSLVPWYSKENRPSMLFSRQAIPMVWDYTEVNPFSLIGGSFAKCLEIVANALIGIPANSPEAEVLQKDAALGLLNCRNIVVSTDPPYYDNIGYADLSDFFYIWLRRSLSTIYPTLFSTIATPKADELVATPYRHGSKENAEAFFLSGMTRAMHLLANQAHPAFPVTIYYAFKESEDYGDNGSGSTGWETFLAALILAGFAITGTWPMRTERQGRMIGNARNALASSIVLVCRKRRVDAPSISRREFIRELNAVLPEALDEMTKGSGEERSPVAPVDLSQAIIGPGMAVFSKYAAVLEADGSPMSVRTALQLINRFLAEDDFDADTQFCLHWFEQHGWTEGAFGEALVLAQSKGTSPDGMKEAGVLQSGSGKVRLLKWAEYPTDWDPRTDKRTPVWEALHQLIRALKQGGESASGALLAALGGKAEAVRQLAYRLYTLCERLGQAEDARAYNELITSWTGIETAAASAPKPAQSDLFD